MFVPRAVNRKPNLKRSQAVLNKKEILLPSPVSAVTIPFPYESCQDNVKSTKPDVNCDIVERQGSFIATEQTASIDETINTTPLCSGAPTANGIFNKTFEGSSTELKRSESPTSGTALCNESLRDTQDSKDVVETLASAKAEVQALEDISDLPDVEIRANFDGIIGIETKPPVILDIRAIRESIRKTKGERKPALSECNIGRSARTAERADESCVEIGTDDFNCQTEKKSAKDIEDEDADDGEDDVVSYSKNQRWPHDDTEPVCVVCRRYGAYICDQTEVDICSRECKARNLARLGLTADKKPSVAPTPDGGDGPEMDAATPAAISDEEEPIGYLYKEREDISELTREQVQEIRAQVELFVQGRDIPRPIIEFAHLTAPKKMESNLSSIGYKTPTPVQMQVIPAALMWRDVMVCAQTSSGKTASFLVPTILQIYNIVSFRDGVNGRPLGLILSPSRELAMQIEDQAKQLMQGLHGMRTALIVGGLPMPPQLHRLKQDIQLIVATPGRILDIINRNGVSLDDVRVVVVDEVDIMLHKGFQQQVMEVLDHLPESRQTLLFSATIPPPIEKMAETMLRNPLHISVGTPNTPCTAVKQIVMWVEEPAKKKNLFAILQDSKHYRPPMVVFVDSKMGAGLLAMAINKMCDIRAASLHGDRPQSERTETLKCFREGEYPVLVCTAVLGRGIDLPGVRMVVNFDMPNSVEEYIHQIGRTGRLGSKGTALTFINNGSKHLFLEFVNTIKPLGVPLPPQLTNSTHLHYQEHSHRRWQDKMKRRRQQEDEDETGKQGNESYFGYKRRKQETSVIGDLLQKRKHSKRPR